MGIFDWVKQKQEDKRKAKEAEEELRRQAEAEISDEVVKIKKDKIKAQILSEARGDKKPESKGMTMLKQLGDEFKNSSIGNTEQMDKLLGKRATGPQMKGGMQQPDQFSTERLMGAIGGGKQNVKTSEITGRSVNTKQDLAGTLGGRGPSEEKLRMMAGVKDNTESLKKMSRLKKE